MKAPPFAYVRAPSLADAFKLWTAAGAEAKLLAGGQTLLATLAFRLVRAQHPHRHLARAGARGHRNRRSQSGAAYHSPKC